MNILVACEESQAVTKKLRQRGHIAYSCDIVDSTGGYPEWHIKQSALPLLNGNCSFVTSDGNKHWIYTRWDMIIAFPPCTHLTKACGNLWAVKKEDGRQQQGIDFFLNFVNADCDRIAIENPVGIMSTVYRKPDQIIQPYWFGEDVSKATCLWLKNLPKLQSTEVVVPSMRTFTTRKGTTKRLSEWFYKSGFNKKDRASIRSKTFDGVAAAMAEQWSNEEFPIQHSIFDKLMKYDVQIKLERKGEMQ